MAKNKNNQHTPIRLERYLSGVGYPANKQALLSRAKEKDAPKEVLGLLNALPNREFKSPAEVAEEMWST